MFRLRKSPEEYIPKLCPWVVGIQELLRFNFSFLLTSLTLFFKMIIAYIFKI